MNRYTTSKARARKALPGNLDQVVGVAQDNLKKTNDNIGEYIRGMQQAQGGIKNAVYTMGLSLHGLAAIEDQLGTLRGQGTPETTKLADNIRKQRQEVLRVSEKLEEVAKILSNESNLDLGRMDLHI